MWQDYVIAWVVIAFNLTTLPMISKRVVLPLGVPVTMVCGAATLIAVYSTLGLWSSVITEIGALMLWLRLLDLAWKGASDVD